MGITLSSKALEAKLEAAARLAESDHALPAEWIERTEHISDCPSQTYVAALGVALLAKATDPEVDSLTVKASVSPRAYSMRGAAKVLAGRARDYGYHLGVTRPEPLNNQPWFAGERIDRFTRLKPGVQPFHNAFVRYMRQLNAFSEDEATLALAAFLRSRISYAREQPPPLSDNWKLDVGVGLIELSRVLESFIREDPEGGRRGQALVAAVFDAVFSKATTGAINAPQANDVQAYADGQMVNGAEVKQKPIDEGWALSFAEELGKQGVRKGLICALAHDQKPLDRAVLLNEAEQRYGVTLSAVESVEELLALAVTWSPRGREVILDSIAASFGIRLRELQVSGDGLDHWEDIRAGLSARA
jgi:hypothetical protein